MAQLSTKIIKYLDREVDFATFATPNIIGEIKHYFRDKRNIVKIPRKLLSTHAFTALI